MRRIRKPGELPEEARKLTGSVSYRIADVTKCVTHVGETGGEFFAEAVGAVHLAQQQAAAVAGEVSTGEINFHTAATEPLKFKFHLVTVCCRLGRVHGDGFCGFCFGYQSLQRPRTGSSATVCEKCVLGQRPENQGLRDDQP
jgi:hypothetical protein